MMVILMVIKTKKGYYQIIKNHKQAFNLQVFEECYVEECLDKYPYVVGDLSDGLLRLKGFCDDNRKENYIGRVEDYIAESCAFLCPHYIVKRINKETYEKKAMGNNEMPQDYDDSITPMEKVPFDKESLVLHSTPKTRVRINIDVQKQNKITLGTLPESLRESINKENSNNSTKEVKEVTYYSSSSEGFELPKQNNDMRNKNNNNNNNNKPKKKKNNNNNNNTNNNGNSNNNGKKK